MHQLVLIHPFSAHVAMIENDAMREIRWIVLIKIITQHSNSKNTGRHTTKLKWHVYLVSADLIQASSG